MAVFSRFIRTTSNLTSPVSTKPAQTIISNPQTSGLFSSALLNTFTRSIQKSSSSLSTQIISNNSYQASTSLAKETKLTVPNLTQGNNECGPTSLAMIMKYYGIDPGNYHDMFASDTIGHSPLALRDKAINKGLNVKQGNNGTLEDLAALIDKGIPALTLGIYGGAEEGSNFSINNYISNATNAHWMVVTGYKRDASGKISDIYFNDPNCSTTQCWSATKFQEEFWNDNIIPGASRYYMAMAKPGTFQNDLLKKYMPYDRITTTFSYTLNIIYKLEKSFYAAENTINSAGNSLESAAQTVADTAEDAWYTLTGAASSAANEVEEVLASAVSKISSWIS